MEGASPEYTPDFLFDDYMKVIPPDIKTAGRR